jgi:SHS2 domain-containing protein
MQQRRFEILDHTADAAIRAYGQRAEELFENAAQGMFALMFDLGEIPKTERRAFNLQGETAEDLLVSWLRELLFCFETEHIAFSEFHVSSLSLPADGKAGSIVGEAVGGNCSHLIRLGAAVKAITYHGLRIERGESGTWEAEIVFDV